MGLATAGCLPVSGGGGGGAGIAGMPQGGGFQHSLPADSSIGDALAVSSQETTSACREKLDAFPDDGVSKPGCGYRLVCLPGATAPARLYACVQDTETRPPAAGYTEPQ